MNDPVFSGVAVLLPPELPERLLCFNLLGLALGGLVSLAISSFAQRGFDFWNPLLQSWVALHLLAAAAGLARKLSYHLRATLLAALCYSWAAIVMIYTGASSAVALFLVCIILMASFLYGLWGLAVTFLLSLLLWGTVGAVWVNHYGPPRAEIAADDTVARWLQTGVTFAVGTLMICGLVYLLFRRTAQHFAEEARLRESLAREQALRAQAEITKLRAELARGEAERTLTAMFSIAPIGVALIKDRKILFVNEWICEFLGRPADQLIGHSSEEIYVSSEEFRRVGREFNAALAAGSRPVIEAEVSGHGGVRRWVLLTAAPADEAVGAGRFVVTVSDITAMKRAKATLRESEARLAEIFDHTSDIIFSVVVQPGPVFRLERVNRAAEAYGFPLSRINAGDLSLAELLPPRLAAQVEQHFRRTVESRQRQTIVEVCEFPAGAVKFSTVLVPMLDPVSREPVRLVGFARDLTHHDRLDELQRAKLASDAASQAKSVFLSKMSHEIRTPLNAVLGFTRLLLRDARLDDGQRAYLATIDRNGEHLLSLINDILEISKIEAAKVVLRQSDCSLRELLEYLRTTFGPAAQEKALTFVTHCTERVPPWVAVDEGKLRQILLNLVGNAVKFTPAGSVRIDADFTEADQLILRVSDTGPGMSPQEIALVFRDFEQTELGRQVGGSGLGLTISRGYAKLMGGDIEVQSSPGNGAVFTLSLPCGHTRLAPRTSEGTGHTPRFILSRTSRPVRVLVVDDVSDNRILLSTLLRQVGFEVREATNGPEAVQAVGLWQPHAAVLDLKMPGLDGIAVTRQLRALFGPTRLKLLGMSASVFSGEAELFTTAGADAFLPKPVRDAEILETLGQLLQLNYDAEGHGADLIAPNFGGRPTPPLRPQAFRELVQAVEEGDYHAIGAALDLLLPTHPAFVADARRDLQRFDYDAILGRLEAHA